jgi:hypothetical protein
MAAFYPKPGCARAGVTTVLTMSAGSQATPAFGAQTYIIRVATSGQPAFIKISDGTPTAGTGDVLVGANVVDYFHGHARSEACDRAGGHRWKFVGNRDELTVQRRSKAA